MSEQRDIDTCRRAAQAVRELEEFKHWTRSHVRRDFPHGALTCVHGRLYGVGVSLDYVITTDYPIEHLEAILYALPGDDTLRALAGDDLLAARRGGRGGRDVLEGGEGRVTCVFKSGDGWDILGDKSPPEGDGVIKYDEWGNVNDVLLGGQGSDTLKGGIGKDTLIGGGGGEDILEGGEDEDTYVVRHGDGTVHIKDSGRNHLKFIDAEGNERLISGAFVEDHESGKYLMEGDGESPLTLEIRGGARLTLDDETTVVFDDQTSAESFSGRDFDLALFDTDADETGVAILGDKAPQTDEHGEWMRDRWGNLIPAGDEPGRHDDLYDTAGDDRILALGGRDWIEAYRDGDDHIEGGAGADIIDDPRFTVAHSKFPDELKFNRTRFKQNSNWRQAA